jgi:hypothetical protein
VTEPSADQRSRLQDFASRAQANLDFVERYVKENPGTSDVFEVTQLLTSLLWLVVAANEWLDLEATPLEQLVSEGCPGLVFRGPRPPSNLRELTTFVRNAVAHMNIDFHSDNQAIGAITLWNQQNRRPKAPHTADLHISVADLRRLAEFLPRRCGLIGSEQLLILRPDRVP